MKKTRGFKLRCKLVKIYKWIRKPGKRPTRFQLDAPTRKPTPISKVLTLARSIRRGCKELCSSPKSGYDYIQLGQDPVRTKPGCGVPKGHLAVYVGESQNEEQRYLVPVIYFNHPLFGELLKEAEEVYGFNHPGRITIPCGASEFEKVQMRIATEDHFQRRRMEHCRYWWR
ncbi:hypothetical protein UlMin_001281 [Ulmus minor]